VSVYFPHPEWQRLNERFSTDARPELSEGGEWQFDVQSNINDIVMLSFEGLNNVPQAYDIRLVDKSLKTTLDLRKHNRYAVAGRGEENPKSLALIIGQPAYVDEILTDFKIVPQEYQLSQNFPNPFNPSTTIQFGLPNPDRVSLKIYDILGRLVITLLDDELKDAGYHAIVWNGGNDNSNSVASGVYFVRMQTKTFAQTRKMLMIQ